MLAIGSAIVKLNTYIRIDAIMAPNEPSKSQNVNKSTAHI